MLISFYELPIIKGSLFDPDDPPLIDKVYTFLAPEDELIFHEVYMEKEFNYYFWTEVVTPHNCTMNITVWDPDNMEYDVFHANLSQGDWREIPFGTAIQGIYTIKFEIISIDNLNIYLKLEKAEQCLKEKIPSQLFNRRVFYRVTRFKDGMAVSHYVEFDTDVSYRFYSGRISAISFLNDSTVQLEYYIYDPDNVDFKIYYNATLPSVDEMVDFSFGTAQAGVYIINITIHCNVEAVNIGYAICWDHRIANPTNNTGPSTDNSTDFSQFFSLTSEMMTGMIVIAGVFIAALVVLSKTKKRKNIVMIPN
ncbi:MAG: hypothetical protein ACFE85_10910 [Candidatus Hodarchaeota archaeon]